jgi:hypothetical protein
MSTRNDVDDKCPHSLGSRTSDGDWVNLRTHLDVTHVSDRGIDGGIENLGQEVAEV